MDETNEFRKVLGEKLMNRRDSVVIAGMDFQQVLIERLSELREIWDEIGMTEGDRRDRMQTALNHLKNLLSEMVDEENQMREAMHTSLNSAKKEIDILLKQLRQPRPAFLNDTALSLLELTERCGELKLELATERDSRLADRDRLLYEYKKYAERLDLAPHDFDLVTIPDQSMLRGLKDDVQKVKEEWETNLASFNEKKVGIAKMVAKVSMDGYDLSPFQRQLLANAFKNDAPPILSRRSMLELADLENLLHERYDAFLREIRERIGIVQFELNKWWDQCHVPIAERERFRTADPELNPERAVEQYNEAITFWRAFYESRKNILDKIGEWERLWQEHVEFEERERDPNRYKNRGGALLEEEKRRKKVVVLLPQVYKHLASMVAEYDIGHPDTPFLMDSIPVMNYIDSIEYEYQEKKKREKEEKEMLKKQQLMTERLYGAVPSTPTSQKKRVGMEKTVTPSKLASASKYVHSSLALARSPIGNKTSALPGSNPGSSTKKPPTGLPSRAQTVKRKVLMDNQEPEQQPVGILDPDQHSTVSTSSAQSYGEFAKILRARGVEVQSSFIGTHPQPRSPTKMPRGE